MATYPIAPAIPQGTDSTPVDTTNYNVFVDNINAIGQDLVDARGDGQVFPGTDHTSGQSTDIDDAIQAIRHMIADIMGETYWYTAPDNNIAAMEVDINTAQTDITALETDVDGFPDALKDLTETEILELQEIGSTTISAAQWAYVGDADQAVKTTSSPTFASLIVTDAIDDGQLFPGNDHTAGQSSNLDDILSAIKHMLRDITGETYWYDEPADTITSMVDDIAALGSAPSRKVVLHPLYAGGVVTEEIRGGTSSGNNAFTVTDDVDYDSGTYKSYTVYYAVVTGIAGGAQDYHVQVRFTLPDNFDSWATSDAVKFYYKTKEADTSNGELNITIYKRGTAAAIATEVDLASTSWTSVSIDDSVLGSWAAGDVMEIDIKFQALRGSGWWGMASDLEFNYES